MSELFINTDLDDMDQTLNDNPLDVEPEPIVCRKCEVTFFINDEEKLWYTNKGFHLPKNCAECRRKKRQRRRQARKGFKVIQTMDIPVNEDSA